MTENATESASPEASQPVEQSAPESSQDSQVEAHGDQVESPKAVKTKKYKVNGREVEVDLSNEKKLDEYIQKGLGADQRFREAKQLMDAMEQKFGKMPDWQKNPFWKVIADGADPMEVAEALLLEKIKWEEMSPEQRDYEQTKRERDSLKAEREKFEKQTREQQKMEAQSQAAKEIDDELTQAVKAMGKKPTPRLIARIAETMLAEHERQISPLLQKYGSIDKIPDSAFQAMQRLPAGEAVSRVHQEYLRDIGEYLGAMPIEEVMEVLPKQVLDGLREHGVKAVLSQDPLGSRKERDPAKPQVIKRPAKKMSTDDFFKSLEKKLG